MAAAGGGQLRFGLQEHELHPPCVRRLQGMIKMTMMLHSPLLRALATPRSTCDTSIILKFPEGRAGRDDLDYLLRRRRQHPSRLRHGRRRVPLPRPEPPPDRRSSSIGYGTIGSSALFGSHPANQHSLNRGREGEAAALASAHVVAPSVRNGLLLRCHPLWLITAVCMQPTQPNQLQTPTLCIVFVFALFDATCPIVRREERRGGEEGKRQRGGGMWA